MANQFVTEMIFKGVGLETILSAMKSAGASQKELKQITEEVNRTIKQQNDLALANNKLIAEKGQLLKKVQESFRQGQGDSAGTSSYAKMLGTDPTTRDFVRYQSAVSKAQAGLSKATDPAEIKAIQTNIAALESQYGSLGKRIADTAGISQDMFLRKLTPEQYVAVVEAAKKLNEETDKHGKKQRAAGESTRFNTNQIMQLTAAARNTAESLASGISVQTTLLTQGMQVLGAVVGDSWKLIAGLAGAAAVGAVALAPMIRAIGLMGQEREIRAASIAYNNFTGSVAETAKAMRDLADNSAFSRSEALATVKELTKARALSVESRQGIMSVVADFATGTGSDLAGATKQLTEAFAGGYEGVRKLDEVYGFLDNSQLTAIRSMMRLGQTAEAQRLALDAFTKQMRETGKIAKSDATVAFEEMAKAYNDAMDAMARHPATQTVLKTLTYIGRGIAGSLGDENAERKQLQERLDRLNQVNTRNDPMWSGVVGMQKRSVQGDLDRLNKRVADRERARADALAFTGDGLTPGRSNAADLSAKQVTPVQEALDQARQIAAMQPYLRAAKQARKDSLKATMGRTDITDTDKDRLAKLEYQKTLLQTTTALNDQQQATRRQVDAEVALAQASFNGARAMAEMRAQAVGIETDFAGGNAAVAKAAELDRIEATALQSVGSQYSEMISQQKLVSDAREVGIKQATVEMQLRKLGLDGTKSEEAARKALSSVIEYQLGVQKRLNDANTDYIKTQTAMLSGINDTTTAFDRQYQESVAAAEFARQQARERGDVNADVNYKGAISAAQAQRDLERARAGRDLRMQLNPEAVRDQQRNTLAQTTGLSAEEIATQNRIIEREYQDNLIKRKELEDDWASGAERAWLKYRKNVGTVADQVEGVMTNAFSSMEDALVKFAMTGKLSFTDMANSIIADLIRMQVRMSITNNIVAAGGFGGILSGIAGWFGGGESTTSTVGGSDAAASLATAAHGGAFDQGGKMAFARGGVVNSITPFRFGQGGAFPGVMGEAGPEAIVPLTRTAQGDLGIRSVGGGGSQVKVEVIDQRGSNAAPIDVETQMGAFGPIVRIIARDEANKAVAGYAKGGGLTNDLRRDYGVRQPAVARG